jgi:hypothetical protein
MPKLPLSSPRTRIINFRVNEQEYDAVCSACRTECGQNLSEFARRATIEFARLRGAGGPDELQNRLDTFGQKLSRVDSVLAELVSSLRPVRTVR